MGLEAGSLTSGELSHAGVIGVVHEVVDGVYTSARAGVTAGGAAKGRHLLGGGVGDTVAGSAAAALEGVVEANPVTGFVRQGLQL